MDLNAYLLPSLARKIQNGSKEKSLAELSIRNLWHAIFDLCPNLLLLSPPDGKKIIDYFLIWADDNKLSMGWSLHVHLLNWLLNNPIWRTQLSVSHKQELLVASAVRWAWAIAEDIKAKGVILAYPDFGKVGIGAWRNENATKNPKFFLLQIPAEYFPSRCAYAISYEQNVWGTPTWIDLPK